MAYSCVKCSGAPRDHSWRCFKCGRGFSFIGGTPRACDRCGGSTVVRECKDGDVYEAVGSPAHGVA